MPLDKSLILERDILKNYIQRFFILEDKDLDIAYENITLESFVKGDKLSYSQDNNNRNIYIVTKGLCRGFASRNNHEITFDFYQKGDLMTSFESLLMNTSSQVIFEFIEDTQVIVVNADVFELISKTNRFIDKLWRFIIEDQLVISSQNIKMHLYYTVKERYLDLMDKNPDFFRRIPLKYIASYLGVRQQSLSRIRHELAHNSKE